MGHPRRRFAMENGERSRERQRRGYLRREEMFGEEEFKYV